jgi:hypothetical protein
MINDFWIRYFKKLFRIKHTVVYPRRKELTEERYLAIIALIKSGFPERISGKISK